MTDDRGRILLQRRADSGNWALPGGGMDMTESLTGSVIREVKEETGYDIEVTGLVGTYTDPRHIIAYTNGEVRRQFNPLPAMDRLRPDPGAVQVLVTDLDADRPPVGTGNAASQRSAAHDPLRASHVACAPAPDSATG